MKYVKSNYTYYVEDKRQIILFNSLMRKIAVVRDKEAFFSIVNNCTRYDEDLYEKLYINEFWIEEEKIQDEKEVARSQRMDVIYNKGLFLTILPTLQCNFRCEYCYENFSNIGMTNECKENLIQYIKRNIKNYNLLKVDWFGGEPLLEKKTIIELSQAIIEACHQAKTPYIASMTTNGYLLSADVFREMLKNHIRTFQITLDGLRETHDKSRHLINGNNTFDTIINNLKEISRIQEKYFDIVIRTNVTYEIYQSLEKYLKYLSDEFGKDKRFTFLFRPVGDWGGDRVKKMQSKLLNGFTQVYEKLLQSPYELDYRVYYSALSDSTCETAKRNSLIVNTDGIIKKCTMYLDHPMNIVGKLDKGRIQWDIGKLSKWNLHWEKMAEQCNTCPVLPTCCNSACPAQKIIRNQEAGCGYENSYVDFVLKLLGKSPDKYDFIQILD